jgi:hypothetical protein
MHVKGNRPEETTQCADCEKNKALIAGASCSPLFTVRLFGQLPTHWSQQHRDPRCCCNMGCVTVVRAASPGLACSCKSRVVAAYRRYPACMPPVHGTFVPPTMSTRYTTAWISSQHLQLLSDMTSTSDLADNGHRSAFASNELIYRSRLVWWQPSAGNTDVTRPSTGTGLVLKSEGQICNPQAI